MEIYIRNAFEKAVSGSDVTVFIDVFRASTTLAYLLSRGAEVLCAQDMRVVEQCRTLGYTLVSEVVSGGLDNSPSQSYRVGGADKLIQKTGNFTAAIFANLNFTKAITAAFVNVSTVAEYLHVHHFKHIDIVACGHFDECRTAIEDLSCAEMLGQMLSGIKPKQVPRLNEIMEKINKRRTGSFTFPKHYWRDLELALQCDTIPVVPVIQRLPTGLPGALTICRGGRC